MVNRNLLVLFIEELGIFQTWYQHPFITLDHVFQVVAVTVADRDKVRQKLALMIANAEEALVVLHGGNQDFFRQDQIFFIKRTGK